MIKELPYSLERHVDAVACACGGYADRVESTDEEKKKYGCGRSFGCCDRAFVCRICKTRLVGRAESPEGAT